MIFMKRFTTIPISPTSNRKVKTKILITQMANFFIADLCLLPGSIIILLNKSSSHFLKKLQTKSAKKSKSMKENRLRKKRKTKKA